MCKPGQAKFTKYGEIKILYLVKLNEFSLGTVHFILTLVCPIKSILSILGLT